MAMILMQGISISLEYPLCKDIIHLILMFTSIRGKGFVCLSLLASFFSLKFFFLVIE